MGNESTKEQIRRFLQNAVDEAKNPSKKEQIRRKRMEKAKKVEKMYGF
jgi:hypothetical protein